MLVIKVNTLKNVTRGVIFCGSPCIKNFSRVFVHLKAIYLYFKALNMRNLFLFILMLFLVACSEYSSVEQVEMATMQQRTARASVNIDNQTSSNPNLLNNWENVNTIVLNTLGSNNVNKKVSSPWATGTSSFLDENFRKDIKKEDGWVMLFHTFKEIGLDEKQNYMCFYNQFTGYLKVFYYYEGEQQSQGTSWIVKTSDGSNSQIFNLTNYFADTMTEAKYNMAVFSNLSTDATNGIMPGWNGFEFEVPYCTDYKGRELTIGAYDKRITTYDFTGKLNLKSSGIITPTQSGSEGILPSIASLAGNGAKQLVDNYMEKANSDKNSSESKVKTFGQKLAGVISSIPAGGYTQAISAGLGLLFGKTTVVNNYDVKLTTSGTASYVGHGTTEVTSGVPSVTFDLYSLMNSKKCDNVNQGFVYNLNDGQEHYVGVWNISSPLFISYRRMSLVNRNWWHFQDDPDGTDNFYIFTKTEMPVCGNLAPIKYNPDIEKFLTHMDKKVINIRCDSLYGEKYKATMIDVGDRTEAEILYRDKFCVFYSTEGKMDIFVKVRPADWNGLKNLYYDWGNIDCGRAVSVVGLNNSFCYGGKSIEVTQTRSYQSTYKVDISIVEDVPEYNMGNNVTVNYGYPYFDEKKKAAGLPIIDYLEIEGE